MPRSYHTPILNGWIQTAYNHQFGTAYPGQLWSVTDNTLVDHGAVKIDDPTAQLLGLMPGRACSAELATDSPRTGVDPYIIVPFTPATVATGLFGVLVRNEQMSSNSDGLPCWFDKETANWIRAEHWGRIWVELEVGATIAIHDDVFIQTDGTFNNAGGTAWNGAFFISENKDGIAAIAFRGIGA